MRFTEERMKSFVDRGNNLIQRNRTKEAMKLMQKGFNYYTRKILKAIVPVSASDEGMISLILYHIANEIERNNPKAAEFREGMEKCITMPEINFTEQHKKPNRE